MPACGAGLNAGSNRIETERMTLKICIAQLNLVVGDLTGNAQKIITAARQAYRDGAHLVLTPELSICGYAAEDLFLRPAFIAACDEAVARVAAELASLQHLSVVVGHPCGGDVRTRSVALPQRFNSASVLCEGKVVATYAKRELPNYQVFDERRYFTAGNSACVFEAGEPGQRVKVGLLICEDAWFESPARQARDAGAELLAVINASPFHLGKGQEREQKMRERVLDCQLPLLYAHLVGGQDEVVFEGYSFVLDAAGQVVGRAPGFQEYALAVQVERVADGLALRATVTPHKNAEADLWDALVLGVRDYVGKTVSRACCWDFPAALIRPWFWPSLSMHWAKTKCAR